MRAGRVLLVMAGALAVVLNTGCTTLADARQAKGTGTARVFDAPADAVWREMPRAVKDVGLEFVGDNRGDGYALAQRGITAFSYGENVAIFIEEVARNLRTRVEVVSKKTLETNIFAPNWEVELLDRVGQRLAALAVEASKPVAAPRAEPVKPAVAAKRIDDVDAVPLLNERGRQGYREWLTKKHPRAFVVAEDGSWSATWGFPQSTAEPADAAERALFRCNQRGRKKCRLYAVDNRVVWAWE
jgi:hypothetical protein